MSGSLDLDANERLQACLWSASGNEDVSRHVLTDLLGRRGETEAGKLRVTPKTLAERYGVETARKVLGGHDSSTKSIQARNRFKNESDSSTKSI